MHVFDDVRGKPETGNEELRCGAAGGTCPVSHYWLPTWNAFSAPYRPLLRELWCASADHSCVECCSHQSSACHLRHWHCGCSRRHRAARSRVGRADTHQSETTVRVSELSSSLFARPRSESGPRSRCPGARCRERLLRNRRRNDRLAIEGTIL